MPWVKIAKKSDFQDGQIRTVAAGSKKLAVARVGGRFFAIDDACTHRRCSLGKGTVSDGEVECPCHGSRFALATGEIRSLPATVPVETFKIKVEGEDVLVEI